MWQLIECYVATEPFRLFITSHGRVDFIPFRNLTGNFTNGLQLTPGSPIRAACQPAAWQDTFSRCHRTVQHVAGQQALSRCRRVSTSHIQRVSGRPGHSQSFSLSYLSLCHRTHARHSTSENFLTIWCPKHTYCLTQSFLYLLESLFALLTPRKLIILYTTNKLTK